MINGKTIGSPDLICNNGCVWKPLLVQDPAMRPVTVRWAADYSCLDRGSLVWPVGPEYSSEGKIKRKLRIHTCIPLFFRMPFVFYLSFSPLLFYYIFQPAYLLACLPAYLHVCPSVVTFCKHWQLYLWDGHGQLVWPQCHLALWLLRSSSCEC